MREEYFGSTNLYCAHPWKLKEEEEEEEEKEKEEEEEEEEERVHMIYDILKIRYTNKIKTNEKEAIPCEKECLSLQSETQGTGRL